MAEGTPTPVPTPAADAAIAASAFSRVNDARTADGLLALEEDDLLAQVATGL